MKENSLKLKFFIFFCKAVSIQASQIDSLCSSRSNSQEMIEDDNLSEFSIPNVETYVPIAIKLSSFFQQMHDSEKWNNLLNDGAWQQDTFLCTYENYKEFKKLHEEYKNKHKKKSLEIAVKIQQGDEILKRFEKGLKSS